MILPFQKRFNAYMPCWKNASKGSKIIQLSEKSHRVYFFIDSRIRARCGRHGVNPVRQPKRCPGLVGNAYVRLGKARHSRKRLAAKTGKALWFPGEHQQKSRPLQRRLFQELRKLPYFVRGVSEFLSSLMPQYPSTPISGISRPSSSSSALTLLPIVRSISLKTTNPIIPT